MATSERFSTLIFYTNSVSAPVLRRPTKSHVAFFRLGYPATKCPSPCVSTEGSMCLCTWHKLLTYSSYLFIFKWFPHARYTWHGAPTAVSPFPSTGFDLRNAIQTLPGDPPMKWTSSWVPALPLAPKTGRAGLSGQIDSWQLYCGGRPMLAGLW